MLSRYSKGSLPSVSRTGLFSYSSPFSLFTAAGREIDDIAKKYSFHSGSYQVAGLNYLFLNNFISLEEADTLAQGLVNWSGISIDWKKNERVESTFFTADHMDALIALVQDRDVRQIPLENIVENIKLLTSDQARRIANGLTREEAISNLPYRSW